MAGKKGWLIWAGLVGYLIYAYGLYAFDRVLTILYPGYLAVLSLSTFAALHFFRDVRLDSVQPRADRIPPRRLVAGLFATLVVLFAGLWASVLWPAMISGVASATRSVFVLDLAFALPLVALTVIFLWQGRAAGDLLAVPMLMKVGTLGVSVFLGGLYASWMTGDPVDPGEMALYALMGFGPLCLVVPFMRAVTVKP